MSTAARVLSRIFIWGGGGGEGKPILKNIFEPRGGNKKNFFRPSRGPGIG